MVLAEVTDRGLLWTLFYLFFMVIYFMIIFGIIGDLFRSKDLSGVVKAVWIFALLFLPLLGPLVYMVTRGSGMTERMIAAQKDAAAQMQDMANAMATSDDPADQIAKAKGLLDSGAISAEEFERLKAKALS